MRVLFGRDGFAASPAGQVVREMEPDWEVVDGTGEAFQSLVATVDVVSPIGEAVTAKALEGSEVRLVQQFGVGLDAIDLVGARRLGIPVANLPGDMTGNANSVAELAVFFALALVRRVEAVREDAEMGRYPLLISESVFGRRILIVGLGAVGAAIAVRLVPFQVDLVGIRADPAKGGVPGLSEVHSLDELHVELGRADVVILCAPAGDGPLLDRGAIAALHAGAVVVNVGRGALIDEDALLEALESGAVAGAGLDVLVEEPPRVGHPLVRHPAVIATPHIAGLTHDSLTASAQRLVENVRRLTSAAGPFWVRN